MTITCKVMLVHLSIGWAIIYPNNTVKQDTRVARMMTNMRASLAHPIQSCDTGGKTNHRGLVGSTRPDPSVKPYRTRNQEVHFFICIPPTWARGLCIISVVVYAALASIGVCTTQGGLTRACIPEEHRTLDNSPLLLQ